jgi:hypothetical protein
MSEYSDFPKDFLQRTQKNLESYKGQYEVTNLINNCLGLIIIPKQLLRANISEYEFTLTDRTYGISRKNIKLERNNNYTLSNIIRHIRNGIAHGRIEQVSEDSHIYDVDYSYDKLKMIKSRVSKLVKLDKGKTIKVISGIRIYDKNSERALEKNFSVDLTVKELKALAISLSNEFINE